VSPRGNLYASLLLRPKVGLAEAATISLVAALALGDALARVAEEEEVVAVKWPNDVLLDGAKVAGILLEAVEEGGRCAWLIVGLGVNVGSAPSDLPYAATSLAAAGIAVTPDELLRLWLAELRYRLNAWEANGFAAMRQDWLERAHGLGGTARLRLGDELVTGRFADLDTDGAVLLENELGCLTRYTAGELVFQ
jgi:BirA family biotin operon repressor/biotin-[acetyl-CoA-carboxylase] ligase